MIRAFLILIGCDFAGDCLRTILHLPLPGAVLGMLLLTAALAGGRDGASTLDRAADALLADMGLLFVPAGVGIVAQAGLLRTQWAPVTLAVVGSTVIGLAVTGLVMHALACSAKEEPAPAITPTGARP